MTIVRGATIKTFLTFIFRGSMGSCVEDSATSRGQRQTSKVATFLQIKHFSSLSLIRKILLPRGSQWLRRCSPSAITQSTCIFWITFIVTPSVSLFLSNTHACPDFTINSNSSFDQLRPYIRCRCRPVHLVELPPEHGELLKLTALV